MGHCGRNGHPAQWAPVSRIRIEIGPVPSSLAPTWIVNSRSIVAGVRTHAASLSIRVRDEMLDLIEALLDVLDCAAARDETFHWTADIEVEPLRQVAAQWLEIGRLTDEELARIGCSWAPEETRPFSDAVAAGALDALQRAGEPAAHLVDRLVAANGSTAEPSIS
jgi:hypothetical protein